MSVIDTLIYDRTQQDLLNETDKAYISYTDLNRIEEAVKYVSDLLNKYAYYNSTDCKINWDMAEIRKQEDCDRIKANYEELKKAYVYKFDIPSFNWSTIQEANDIEKILIDIEALINYMRQCFVHSGVCNSAQPRVWQRRFRRTTS